MRYLIVSDVHGNRDALAAVLEALAGDAFDEVLSLGDLVGYGAEPNGVVETLRALDCPVHAVRGNHDKVAAGIDEGAGFNAVALSAARWTAATLEPEHLEYVRSLPRGPLAVSDGLSICHGSPLDEDEYLLSAGQAARSLAERPVPLTFFGHTHIPTVFAGLDDQVEVAFLDGGGVSFELEAETRYLINPGSVGQPRDRDPRAAYMLYDSAARRVELHRLDYPVEAAQRRILDAGLPPVLAQRLAAGL